MVLAGEALPSELGKDGGVFSHFHHRHASGPASGTPSRFLASLNFFSSLEFSYARLFPDFAASVASFSASPKAFMECSSARLLSS